MRRILLLLLVGWASSAAFAQTPERYITWEHFVETLREETEGDEEVEEGLDAEMWEHLQQLYEHPYNINTVERDELLALPFLCEAQVDSLLAYRTRRVDRVQSLGELQFVSGLDYYTRAFLSLFLYAGPAPWAQKPSFLRQLYAGKHEVSTRIDLPLYFRQGFYAHKKDDVEKAPAYAGHRVGNLTRYRYDYGKQVRYGITLERDPGERGVDYVSAYAQMGGRIGRAVELSAVVGDYEVRAGEGLLLGQYFFTSRECFASSRSARIHTVRPHTSAYEGRFMRGGAATVRYGRASLTAFISHRRLDATTERDTLRTFLQTGLHRTDSEIARRHVAPTTTGGLLATYHFKRGEVGAGALWEYNAYYVSPRPAIYNTDAFRGRSYSGYSLQYAFRAGRRWFLHGEAALDHRAHWATSHVVQYTSPATWRVACQLRALTPQFQSQWGRTLQLASGTRNEWGALLSVEKVFADAWMWRAYFDAAYQPRPTYVARAERSHILAAGTSLVRTLPHGMSLGARYTIRSRQYTITGYALPLEHRTTQRARLFFSQHLRRWTYHVQGDVSAVVRQTSPRSLGYGITARVEYHPLQVQERLSLRAGASLFSTDDFASAIYVYHPRLRLGGVSNTALYYAGTRETLLAVYRPVRRVELSASYALLYYFNRDHIGSGTQEIKHRAQNDLTLALRLLF